MYCMNDVENYVWNWIFSKNISKYFFPSKIIVLHEA